MKIEQRYKILQITLSNFYFRENGSIAQYEVLYGHINFNAHTHTHMHTICSERTDTLHISYGVWKCEEGRGRIIGQDEAENYILEERNIFFKNLELCIEERVIQ